jgi:hypothetical protein
MRRLAWRSIKKSALPAKVQYSLPDSGRSFYGDLFNEKPQHAFFIPPANRHPIFLHKKSPLAGGSSKSKICFRLSMLVKI